MSIRVYIKLGILSIFAGLLWYAWIYAHQENHFPIQQVKILGDYNYVTKQKLQKKITTFINKGYFNVNVNKLRDALMALPGIKSVAVKRTWPDTVRVIIQQQPAFARWNKNKILSRQATIFTPEQRMDENNLPHFIGAKHNAKTMLKTYQHLSLITGDLYQIQTLTYRGNQWGVTLESGTNIILGNHNIEQRLEQFIKYYPILIQTHKGQTISYFDTRYPSGFSIKWKKIS